MNRNDQSIGAYRTVSALLLGGLFATPLAIAQTFIDVTIQAGINHVQTTEEDGDNIPGAFMTGGVAAADFDNDGWTDLLFTRLNDTDILYHNNQDGTFTPLTATAGFTQMTKTNGVVSGDIDNDGDCDLYMTALDTTNYLYMNDGTGFFTLANSSRGAALDNGIHRLGQGATFADYDNDGYIDLMACDWGNPLADSQSRLLHNRGSAQPGFFDDVTTAAGIDVYRASTTYRFAPRFVDLDRDGLMDLTIASDFHTSQLFWNNGDGTFTDGTLPANVGTDFNGMGTSFADYDRDGDLDWFITNITEDPDLPPTGFGGWNRLYRNDGNRVFTDVTEPAGVRDSRWSWGTTFFDYDNDGDADLIATNGFTGTHWIMDRTFLWNNNEGVFTDVSDAEGITDRMQGRGLVHLDYDNDGDLDIVVVNNEAAPILYRNEGNANDYLRITTEGTASNRDGIGAFITVLADIDVPAEKIVWEIDGGSSFLSQNERTAHFGLGMTNGIVDLVRIDWPSGQSEYIAGLAANQTVHQIEGNSSQCPFAIADEAAALKIFLQCFNGPDVASQNCPLDLNADCDTDNDVDLREFAALQTAL